MTMIRKTKCKVALESLRTKFPGVGRPNERLDRAEELQEALSDLDVLTDQDEDGNVFLDGFNVDDLASVRLLPRIITALDPFLED